MNLNPWSVALGVFVTGALHYFFVPALVKFVRDKAIRDQARDQPDIARLSIRQPTYGGDILGHFECAIFFASFIWPGAIALAPAWLVFKAAAKWKTWDTSNVNAAEISVMYRMFLIGTAANIVAAFIGAAVVHLP
jgi:hypothetical protein